jgi:hypothetical protein
MKQGNIKKIEEMISSFTCPKDFMCYKMRFKNLCNAKDLGISQFLECLEENPTECSFSISFGNSYLCECPLRIYIAKSLA